MGIFTEHETVFDVVADFKRLTDLREKLKADLKAIEDERDKTEERLAEKLANAGCGSIKVNGITYYTSTRSFCSVSKEFRKEMVDEARKMGLDEMITLQPKSFSAWCQEYLADPANGGHLPEGMRDKVNQYDKTGVGMRRS